MEDTSVLDGLRRIVERACALALDRTPTSTTRKAHQDFVTDIDMAVDAFLAEALIGLLPGVPVLSEERVSAVSGPLDRYWIVDPIDGTGNLVAGLPFVGISVALVDAKGPQMACVASVGEGVLYSALRGHGAFRAAMGQPAQALSLPEAAPELIVLSTGVLDAIMPDPAARWSALRRLGKIRNLGAQSLHLCGVAAGQFAAVASIEARVWDEAAGGLVIREAGGHWGSVADTADWSQPATLMNIAALRSLACHPHVRDAMTSALAGIVGENPS